MPTPRPHFIITRIKKEKSPNELQRFLTNSNDMKKVFELCLKFLNSIKDVDFKKSNIIFSVHTGCFSSTNEFHAHLSVDREEYKKFFDKRTSDNFYFKPTQQWDVKSGSTKSAYIASVDMYPQKQLDKFKIWTEEDILRIENQHDKRPDLNRANELKQITSADVFLHSSLPKLGFKIRNNFLDDISKYSYTLQIMAQYALNRGYFKKPGGSHLCIYLNNKSNFDVTGYILTNGAEYYKLFDESHQLIANRWIENFKNEKYFVET